MTSWPWCRGMRNTMPWQLPPDSMPKTRPGFWGVPRLMVLHIFSARCQPKTRAVRRSQKSKSGRSEEHTSELQSPCNLVCRLLLEKKKKEYSDTFVIIIYCRYYLAATA